MCDTDTDQHDLFDILCSSRLLCFSYICWIRPKRQLFGRDCSFSHDRRVSSRGKNQKRKELNRMYGSRAERVGEGESWLSSMCSWEKTLTRTSEARQSSPTRQGHGPIPDHVRGQIQHLREQEVAGVQLREDFKVCSTETKWCKELSRRTGDKL